RQLAAWRGGRHGAGRREVGGPLRVARRLARVGLLDKHHHGLETAAVAVGGLIERGPDLEHPFVIGPVGRRGGRQEVDRQQLVTVDHLHVARDRRGLAPATDRSGGGARRGRRGGGGGGQH